MRITSGNVSVHDIMRCNERKLAALCGNQIRFTCVERAEGCWIKNSRFDLILFTIIPLS